MVFKGWFIRIIPTSCSLLSSNPYPHFQASNIWWYHKFNRFFAFLFLPNYPWWLWTHYQDQPMHPLHHQSSKVQYDSQPKLLVLCRVVLLLEQPWKMQPPVETRLSTNVLDFRPLVVDKINISGWSFSWFYLGGACFYQKKCWELTSWVLSC